MVKRIFGGSYVIFVRYDEKKAQFSFLPNKKLGNFLKNGSIFCVKIYCCVLYP